MPTSWPAKNSPCRNNICCKFRQECYIKRQCVKNALLFLLALFLIRVGIAGKA